MAGISIWVYNAGCSPWCSPLLSLSGDRGSVPGMGRRRALEEPLRALVADRMALIDSASCGEPGNLEVVGAVTAHLKKLMPPLAWFK